jgi:6,7-dimethyl-8-ribityllumazine synthase
VITPSLSTLHFAIVVSRFNQPITSGLLAGAAAALADAGVADANVTVVHVPGAFEIPLVARALAASGRFDAVICLGCLIKGDTMHFEYIASAAAQGIMEAGLASGIPVTFGVLTTLTDAQAEERAAPGPGNKGREAAQAALDMTAVLRDVQARFGR